MNKLKYNLDKEGNISAIGFKDFEFEVDETCPFQSVEESMFYKKVDGEWQKYDPTWLFEQFKVRVTIPESVIIDNDMYIQLRDWVLYLKSEGRADFLSESGNRVMYFVSLLPEHEALLKSDSNVKIEYYEAFD